MRIVTSILIIIGLLSGSLNAYAGATAVTARLQVSNPSPYLGEEIDLLLEVTYNRHPGGRTRFNWPNLDNFVSADLTNIRSQRSRDAQNRLVETLYRRIRPIQSGTILLQQATVRSGGLNITVAPLALRVKPLPVTGRPNRFDNQIGSYRLTLEADGNGPREISLQIYDSNQLAPLPDIRSWPKIGERLIPIETITRPTGTRGREHTLRYFYIPEKAEPGELRFSLSIFDPEQQIYLEVETGPAHRSTTWPQTLFIFGAILLGICGLIFFWFKRRPRTIDGCLEQLCQRPVPGLARENIQAVLNRYLEPDGQAALQRYWQNEDKRRFNQKQQGDGTDCRSAIKRLRQHLWKAIDKQQDNP
jgi:hypothetical protein